jgi:hypothetical protein
MEYEREDAFANVLGALSESLHAACAQRARIDETEEGAHYEIGFVETEIETLIGMAFVACQAYLTAITSDMQRTSKHQLQELFRKSKTDPGVWDILGVGNKVPNTRFTRPQIIHAFANYFKHRDQWSEDWNEKGISKNTIDVLREIGATPKSDANLRLGATLIGNASPYVGWRAIHDSINDWKDGIEDQLTWIEHLPEE